MVFFVSTPYYICRTTYIRAYVRSSIDTRRGMQAFVRAKLGRTLADDGLFFFWQPLSQKFSCVQGHRSWGRDP